MRLTTLFESNKKEIKQRNPVAQELRANPQYKPKTEVDMKKELKKGYQKHKNKLEESTDVDTAYVKNIIAQHQDEYKKFLQTGDLMDAPSVYEKLFAYFHFETGEMPYGTAKARDGDPYVWITDKLADLGLAEQVQEADLNAWYAEQYAKELAEKEGKVWDKMSYGDKEDYRKIANKKYGVVKSEGADVPTQKGRDAKHNVLTPRSKNKVLQQIKHDANKERRSVSKDIERIAKLAGITTASTDESVDQLEATQDLTRQINPLRGIVGANTSAQMTATGLDALSKGQRPSPQQVKAVEPYVSSIAKAIQNPQTSAQLRNIIKKVN